MDAQLKGCMHMKYLLPSIAILGVFLGASRVIADDVSPETLRAARAVAVTTCSTCHGPQGRSIAPKFPRLAGQSADYIAAQMRNFKAHTRGDADALAYMWGMAAPLEDDLIAGLAQYYSVQRPGPGHASDAGAMTRGRTVYMEGVAASGVPACATCHGANAAGVGAFPRLAGQSEQYLLKQLHAFHSNMRDVAVMHGVTTGLSPDNMNDVAAYLASLGP
jgi:cytochrome c553